MVAEAKASAKQKEIALPVTQASRCGFLQGECKGRVRNSHKVNPQICQGSFPSCCSMGWKEEFIPRVRKMFLTLVVPMASLSSNPPEMAGHYPHPHPPTNCVGLLSLLILHLSSLSQILFLIFLSLDHSLYHRFLSYLLLLPPSPPL